jgi:hypothetical protein
MLSWMQESRPVMAGKFELSAGRVSRLGCFRGLFLVRHQKQVSLTLQSKLPMCTSIARIIGSQLAGERWQILALAKFNEETVFAPLVQLHSRNSTGTFVE